MRGQSASALPLSSDVDLLGNSECVIYLDAQVSDWLKPWQGGPP